MSRLAELGRRCRVVQQSRDQAAAGPSSQQEAGQCCCSPGRHPTLALGAPPWVPPPRVTLFLLYFLAVSELVDEILMISASQPAPERHARFSAAHRGNGCAVIALSSFSRGVAERENVRSRMFSQNSC